MQCCYNSGIATKGTLCVRTLLLCLQLRLQASPVTSTLPATMWLSPTTARGTATWTTTATLSSILMCTTAKGIAQNGWTRNSLTMTLSVSRTNIGSMPKANTHVWETNVKAIFNVKGTHYPKTIYQRAGGSYYVVHRGKRFTVGPTAFGLWMWIPWADNNSKDLAKFFK